MGIGIAPGANIGDECALFVRLTDQRARAEICGQIKSTQLHYSVCGDADAAPHAVVRSRPDC